MLTPIKLDYIFLFNTREVCDIFSDGMLAAETMAIKLFAS